jgi:hypothetical protein
VIRCTLCDRLVLGLAGHDWTALPWMLTAGSGVSPGPCHVRCLDERACGAVWAEAVEAYHCRRWPLWLAGVDDGVRWRLHGSRSARRFHLWRADGKLTSFPYAATRTRAMRITTALAEVGTGHAADLLAAMGTDAFGVGVPLAYVVSGLGVSDRYPRIAGTVTRLATDVLVARHSLALDPGCREAASVLIRPE